jgi:hypothetical protein
MYGIYDNGVVIAGFAAPMTVRSNRPVSVSDTLSLKRFASSSQAQRWEIETALIPASSGAQDLFVDIVSKGYTVATKVLMPQNYGSYLARTATGAAVASGSAGASSITYSVAGKIPKGSFVNFGTDSKVYMLTGDAITNGTVGIYPELRVSISGATMHYAEDVVGSFYYDTDVVKGMMYSDGILMNLGTLKLVEAL